MGLLGNLSIRRKLLLIPLFPLLLVSYFVVSEIYEKWQLNAAMTQVRLQFDIATAAADLVHEIQKERGLSAGVVGASGLQLRKELSDQRQQVDRRMTVFRHELGNIDRSRLAEHFQRQLDQATASLDRLYFIRLQVDRLTASLQLVLNTYTGLNAELLKLVSRMATHSDSVEIANQASAYFFLLLGKERAGEERALLSHAFASDRLDPGLRQQFHSLLSEQDSYLQVFNQYAAESDRALTAGILDHEVMDQVDGLRSLALDRSSEFGVAPADWFNLATERINLLQQVKEELAGRLQQTVREQSNEATSDLIVLVLVSIFSVSATLLVSFLILDAISNQLTSLMSAVNRVEEKSDLSVRALEIGDDELGCLARSFNRMLEHLAVVETRVQVLSQAVQQSPISVVITDLEGNIEYVNEAFQKVTGYSEAEVKGQNTRILKSGNTHPRLYREMWQQIIGGDAWQGEFQSKCKDGSIIWEKVHIAPVVDERGTAHHYLAVKSDITASKRQEEQITYQAHYDALTGLPNRFLSLDRLTQLMLEARRRGRCAAVLFVDLDGFKKINDSLGHEAGDRVLVQTAERLSEAVRADDTVGRLGGDEFLVLLGDIAQPIEARRVAEDIINKFQAPFRQQGRDLIVTASIGIAVCPDDGILPAELLRHADMAMYESKKQGRNTYHFFTESMNQGAARRLELEEQLHGALERREFHICYQPMIDLAEDRIVGAEALLRWNNPALGAIPPDEFIPLAEQSELIVQLGQFVLREAMETAADWRDQYRDDFRIAVNVSPRQFRDREFVDFVSDQLQRLELSGDSLELEITEGVLMSGNIGLDKVLDDLHSLEVGIAMDDFGTGYSSLSYLRSYPFDTLKIDRSFVNDISVDSADRELVIAALSMGHGLGLRVVAEGVETEQQLEFLSSQGCDIAQGYLFGRPVPAAEFEKLLKRQSRGMKSVS